MDVVPLHKYWGTRPPYPIGIYAPAHAARLGGFYVMVMELGSRGVPRPLPWYGGLGLCPSQKKLEL